MAQPYAGKPLSKVPEDQKFVVAMRRALSPGNRGQAAADFLKKFHYKAWRDLFGK